MPIDNMTTEIKAALSDVPRDDAIAGARRLLETLGYRSERTLELTGSVHEFIEAFSAPTPDTLTERDFRQEVASVHVVFQITNAEIAESVNAQGGQFTVGDIDKGNSKSFVFIAVELNEKTYPRGDYAKFTREINKRLNQPTVVLFKTADKLLTLAFVHRRPHKRDRRRKVLGSVSLIREIDTTNPHRAHLDILAKLALPERLKWMNAHHKPSNFDGLLDAWLDALDTEELNRSFYKQLFKWFVRAVEEARFPTDQAKVLSSEEHIIRLITRLLFVWFIKEKGLIAQDLFIEEQVGPLLRDYNRENGDSYYRAVLQNLFFATLNSEIGERGFSKRSHSTHRDFSRYRYLAEIANPDGLLELFARTPFINGGLFDCLDSFESTTEGGYRIDSFTDNVIDPKRKEYGILSIPNRLFFDAEGLICLFNRFQFTVEENTPAEQEVALDPELLGKVFENLLAAYNPETRRTARKQTGSYYTPRKVVEYMVDEALVASLAQSCPPKVGDTEFWKERLNYLLDYEDAFDDAHELFEESERECLVRAIAGLKLIDPAVGSGAFPMGALHKLTLALRRLDPDNLRWESLQKEMAGRRAAAAFDTRDQAERDAELDEISATFEKYRDSDFGRKLYLIQNSIYGVDIQPIACQIARLRFFISLAIEQDASGQAADNFDIKPLPNLETRFVAANTLLALNKPGMQMSLTSPEVTNLQEELNANRESHFHATTRQKKKEYRNRDKELRNQLANALHRVVGMPEADAAKIALWDPYDQNAHADWFDAKYMFGVNKGFDIVFGNPPYYQVKKGTYSAAQFPYSEGRDKGKQNLYKLFVELSYNLCKDKGLATLIVQSSLMCDLSSAATRELLLEHTRLKHIIEFPKDAKSRDAKVFMNVTQGTCIYQFEKALPSSEPIGMSVGNDALSIANLRFAPVTKKTILALYPDLRCFPHVRKGSIPILEKIAGDREMRPLGHYTASIVQGDLNLTNHSAKFSTLFTPVRLLRGRHVSRYSIKYDATTEYCDIGFMTEKVDANRLQAFLVSQQITGTTDQRRLHFALVHESPVAHLWGNSVNKIRLNDQEDSKMFLAVLNSKFMDWFFRITSTNNHVQGYELKQLPIPLMDAADRKKLDSLASRIISAKEIDWSADTKELESEVDRLVYNLYGLTEEEVDVVEGIA